MKNILDLVGEQVDEAIKVNVSAWGLEWLKDVSLHLFPGPDGQPMPMVSILLATPSPLVGQYCSNMALLPSPMPPVEAVRAATDQLVNNVLDQRKSILVTP